MAPEYAIHGHFSVKSDVFSFGVLVLEMVCGQKNKYVRNGENLEDLLGCVSTTYLSLSFAYICDTSNAKEISTLKLYVYFNYFVGMEKLEGENSFKYCRPDIEGEFNN